MPVLEFLYGFKLPAKRVERAVVIDGCIRRPASSRQQQHAMVGTIDSRSLRLTLE